MQPIIDKSIKSLIPPLAPEEYEGLEKSIVAEGCRDALVLWDEVLLDGHNRLEICQKHDIKFKVQQVKGIADKEQAKTWVITNQFSRRNLAPIQRVELALKLEEIFQKQAKENEKRGGNSGKVGRQISDNPVDTKKELAKVAGVSHDTIHKGKAILKNASQETKEKLRRGESSINREYIKLKRDEIKKNAPSPSQFPSGKYRVIYADPPWSYGNTMPEGTTQPTDHYPCMTLDKICELPIKDIAEDNAVLFLWVTSPLLEESFQVIKSWGFKYKTSFVWDKVKHNMGHYNSVRHEFLLVCVRGSCQPDNLKLFDSVISEERTEHSKKPKVFYEIIETIYTHGNRIELFSRKKREGWKAYGNQLSI